MKNENNMCSEIGSKYQTCLISSSWMKLRNLKSKFLRKQYVVYSSLLRD